MCCLVTDVCVKESAELFMHSFRQYSGTVYMALSWYACVFVCHGDLCSNLWCVLSLISFKTNVVH